MRKMALYKDINFIAKKVLAMIIKSGVTWGKTRSENLMFHSSSVLKQDSERILYHLVLIILVRAHG